MKKLVIISLSVFALAMASCANKKGVCTCTDGDETTKTYYEDMTASEKKFMKRSCNGDNDTRIDKLEVSGGGLSGTSDVDEDFNEKNCEWSRTGK